VAGLRYSAATLLLEISMPFARPWPLAALTLFLFTTGCAVLFAGCATTPSEYWQALKGEGFPEWNENMAAGSRGDPSRAKPSGFFTDRRSEQIEQNLGGGF